MNRGSWPGCVILRMGKALFNYAEEDNGRGKGLTDHNISEDQAIIIHSRYKKTGGTRWKLSLIHSLFRINLALP